MWILVQTVEFFDPARPLSAANRLKQTHLPLPTDGLGSDGGVKIKQHKQSEASCCLFHQAVASSHDATGEHK